MARPNPLEVPFDSPQDSVTLDNSERLPVSVCDQPFVRRELGGWGVEFTLLVSAHEQSISFDYWRLEKLAVAVGAALCAFQDADFTFAFGNVAGFGIPGEKWRARGESNSRPSAWKLDRQILGKPPPVLLRFRYDPVAQLDRAADF